MPSCAENIVIVPVVAFMLALPLLIRYPITREKHAQLMDEPRDIK
jgi:Na+/melibiose symporter-like transporter